MTSRPASLVITKIGEKLRREKREELSISGLCAPPGLDNFSATRKMINLSKAFYETPDSSPVRFGAPLRDSPQHSPTRLRVNRAGQARPELGRSRSRTVPSASHRPGISVPRRSQLRYHHPRTQPIAFFDGKDLSQWVSLDGTPTKWIKGDGYMECVKGSGYVRTLQNFGDCQLHVEWAAPVPPHGEGQGRGNSGVFFGLDRYEIQVLDSFESKTYADGQAAAVYGQYPPPVNALTPVPASGSFTILSTPLRVSTRRTNCFHPCV